MVSAGGYSGSLAGRCASPAQGAATKVVWQHPFVDVFRSFGLDPSAAERRGDVAEELDRTIGKRVFRIRGSVSANNYLRLPHPRSQTKSLSLTGEYVYLELKDHGLQFFNIHLDFTVAGANVLRVTLSNMFTEVKTASHSVHLPCHIMHQWGVVCVHVPSVLALCTRLPPHSFVLKTIQLCASLYSRGIYTSDIRYTGDTLPKEMMFDHHSGFDDRYHWIDVPGPYARPVAPPVAAPEHLQPRALPSDGGDTPASFSRSPRLSSEEKTGGAAAPLLRSHCSQSPRSDHSVRRHSPRFAANLVETPRTDATYGVESGPPHGGTGGLCDPTSSCEFIMAGGSGGGGSEAPPLSARGLGGQSLARQQPALADPMLEVARYLGVNSKVRKLGENPILVPRRFAVFVCGSSGAGEDAAPPGAEEHQQGRSVASAVLHASSSNLALVDAATSSQKCFFGHTKAVTLLEASDDGLWAASVQEAETGGSPPLLRLWRVDPQAATLRCASVLSCPSLASVRVACFDPLGKFLVLAGLDLQQRQQLQLFDISRVRAGGNIVLLSRQTSADWDIDCLRLSPFEELQIVTCGRENIRFWRVKDKHMRGQSVTLNSWARQTHFTCIAFEFNRMGQPYFLGEHLARHQRMFVGTASGKVLELSYHEKRVQAVFDLHNDAITSMCGSEGFLVTGSADGYVRVWPLDFKSFFVHVLHDSPVVGVDLSSDGLQVLASMADGSVSLLNMTDLSYHDVGRSHGASITDAAISLQHQELVTIAADGTLKVWNLSGLVQTYEYRVPGDEPLAVAFHPGARRHLAVGYKSGKLRVFDIDGPSLFCERHHHLRPVVSLAFVPDAPDAGLGRATVVTADTTGSLVLYGEAAAYEVLRSPERALCATPPERCQAIACLPPRLLQYLDPQTVALCTYPGLALVKKLRVPAANVSSIDFATKGSFALIGTSDSHLYIFSAQTGQLLMTYTLSAGAVVGMGLAACGTAALLVASTVDTLLRLSPLQLGDLSASQAAAGAGRVAFVQSSPEDAGAAAAALSALGLGLQAPPPSSLTVPRGQLEEQVFLGHARAPFKILLAANCVISVSASEVICWAAAGDFLEHICLGDLLPGQTSAGVAVEGPAAMQRAAGAEQPELEQPFGHHEGLAMDQEAEQENEPLRQSVKAAIVEAVVSSPGALAAHVAASLSHNGEEEEEEDEEVDAETLDGDSGSVMASIGGGGEHAAAPATQEEESRGALEVDGVIDGAPEAGGLKALPEAMAASGVEVARGAALLGVCGCATSLGASAVAWSAASGLLCQSLGRGILVESLLQPDSPLPAGAGSAFRGHLAAGEDRVVFALDLDADSGLQLSSLCGSLRGGGDEPVRLRRWCLRTQSQLCSGDLSDHYAAHWARYRDGRPAGLERLPLLRLLHGGRCAITACSVINGKHLCRVDIWDVAPDVCRHRCSAHVAHCPIDLGILNEGPCGGGEFLTLCGKSIVFWRIPGSDEGAAGQLQFQLAEPCETWCTDSAAAGFAAFCLVDVPVEDAGDGTGASKKLLLAGTSQGRIWAYDADENELVGEVRLFETEEQVLSGQPARGSPISALACEAWPLLIRGSSDGSLVAFSLAWEMSTPRQGGRVYLTAMAAGSPRLACGGPVSAILMGTGTGLEGVAATLSNDLWYFHLADGALVSLQSAPAGAGAHSGALRSNVHLRGGEAEESCAAAAVPPLMADCAADGAATLWSLSAEGCSVQAIARFRPSAAAAGGLGGPEAQPARAASVQCTVVCFVRPDLLACGFSSGLLCLCSLLDLKVICEVELGYEGGDSPASDGHGPGNNPVMAIEAIASERLVVGFGSGLLVDVQLQLARSLEGGSPSDGSGWKVAGYRRAALRGPANGGTVCGIDKDKPGSMPRRFLVCFANLEVWLWDCTDCGSDRSSIASARGLRHFRTWTWPESSPRRPSKPAVCSGAPQASCLAVLSAPPLVARFVHYGDSADLVALAAAPATCIYLYSCSLATVVNRVPLHPGLCGSAIGLWSLPTAAPTRTGAEKAALAVLGEAGFAWLALRDGGRRTTWLNDGAITAVPGKACLPNQSAALSDICVSAVAEAFRHGDADAAHVGVAEQIVVKGDVAFSFWTPPF
eukprot:TRINITY_DN31854_c0_g2_i1.p1 TRINITY_DN31854_c0_g2~~TRINITY_DN31854_c0_g2_i1.p1  ORF type:complete len:2111 (-),score=425.53 TRINITY_DN31854_c0_g2_i1:245-6577(-)